MLIAPLQSKLDALEPDTRAVVWELARALSNHVYHIYGELTRRHMYAARDPVYSRVFAPLTGDEASILAGAEHHLPYLWGLTQEQRLTQSTAAAWEGNPPRRPCPNTTMP